jgi:hypothetical protein
MKVTSEISSILIDDRIAFWAFDFDGNILAPETPIYVLDRISWEEIAISGHTLDKHPELISWPEAPYRWHNDIIDSLIHFRDYHSDPRHWWPDSLKEDIEKAIRDNALAPSFQSLKELFLIPARFLTIITSRGHGPDNLARILWIINKTLLSSKEKEEQYGNIQNLFSLLENSDTILSSDQALRYYFEQVVLYYPVSNPHVAKYLKLDHITSMSERKSFAMRHAIDSLENTLIDHPELSHYPLSIGFSDDSLSNILSVMDLFKRLGKEKHERKRFYHLYFTGKKEDYPSLIEKNPNYQMRENMLVLKI